MIALLALALAGQDAHGRVPITLAPGAGPAPTQAPATMVVEPVAMAIAGFDANGDARVTRAELDTGVRRSFASVAKGAKDIGYIDYADWAFAWLGDRNALPSPFEVDRDGDNRITSVELEAYFDRTFARLDKDRDGVLTRAELLTIRATPFGDGERRGKKARRGEDPGRQ